MRPRTVVLWLLLVMSASAVAGAQEAAAAGAASGAPASTPTAVITHAAEETPLPLLTDYKEPVLPETPDPVALMARVLGALALVTGLIVLGVYLMKRFLGGPRLPSGQKRQVRLIEATSLGGKRFIYVVKAVDRLLVIGASGEHITLLSEITDPAQIKAVEAETEPGSFKGFLDRMLPKKSTAGGFSSHSPKKP